MVFALKITFFLFSSFGFDLEVEQITRVISETLGLLFPYFGDYYFCFEAAGFELVEGVMFDKLFLVFLLDILVLLLGASFLPVSFL